MNCVLLIVPSPSTFEKQQISWTHALRKIVINCYKYHGREDLLPTFADDEDKVNALISQSGDEDEDMEQLSNTPTIQTVQTVTPAVTTTTSQVSIDPSGSTEGRNDCPLLVMLGGSINFAFLF